MHVVTHLLVSWSVANVADLDRRSRTIVTLAGIAPDADGLVIVPDFLTRHTDHHLGMVDHLSPHPGAQRRVLHSRGRFGRLPGKKTPMDHHGAGPGHVSPAPVLRHHRVQGA